MANETARELAKKYDRMARRLAKRASQFAALAEQEQPSAAEPQSDVRPPPKPMQRQVPQTELHGQATREVAQPAESTALPPHEAAARSLQRATELEAAARAERERAAEAARQVKVSPPSFDSLPPHARSAATTRWLLEQALGAGRVDPAFARSPLEIEAARGTKPVEPVLPEVERIRREGQDALFSRLGLLPAHQRRVPRKG